MSERPIIFSGEMVRAILEGRKTQTRRVVNPQPSDMTCIPMMLTDGVRFSTEAKWVRCPFGEVGSKLWVRETFLPCGPGSGYYGSAIKDSTYACFRDGSQQFRGGNYHPWSYLKPPLWGAEDRWRPSIHMPRWASRITLEVTGVRVERLQDINLAAAEAEGAHRLPLQEEALGGCWWTMDAAAGPDLHARTAVGAFRKGWDAINGNRATWESNPWVWVVSFRRVTP